MEQCCAHLQTMHKKLYRKQPTLVSRHGVPVLHDNTTSHISRQMVQKLHGLGYEALPHPAYSPDLAPTDYHSFKHLGHFLNNRIFNNDAAVYLAVEDFIASREATFYQEVMNALVTSWQKCIAAVGDYFD